MIDHCSWFFEGSWAGCCLIHDATSLGAFDWLSHWELARCVSQTSGGWGMALTMFAGLVVGGPLYGAVQHFKRKDR